MCLTGCTDRKALDSDSKSKPATAPKAVASICSGSGTCFEGGTVAYSDDKVEVRTGVAYKDAGANDGITITVKSNKDPHVVQFASREIIGADGKSKPGTMTTTGGSYDLTTDPTKPVWNTDSAAKPNPNYEARGAHVNNSDGLTTFDQPAVSWPSGPLNIKEGETSKATFKAYVIEDGKVVREVNWTRSQKYGKDPVYSVDVKEASSLPDWANSKLKEQGYNGAP